MYISGGLDLVALLLGMFAVRHIITDFSAGEQKVPDIKIGKVHGFGFTLQELKANLEDGSAGIKNILGISMSVQCVAGVLDYAVKRIKRKLLPKYPNVDDVCLGKAKGHEPSKIPNSCPKDCLTIKCLTLRGHFHWVYLNHPLSLKRLIASIRLLTSSFSRISEI